MFLRLEREQRFRKSHEDQVTRFGESLSSTGTLLATALKGVKIPVAEFEKYLDDGHVFPDTKPRLARDPESNGSPPSMPIQSMSPPPIMQPGVSISHFFVSLLPLDCYSVPWMQPSKGSLY